ncbi:MAG: branched-chain-amino-acid transaminase [Actinomycetota bacterium]|nr:branched-chain-amino-acid transaminase [Actinomycetota bacterium]
MEIYLDGRYVSEGEASISVFDHGLLYGDGIFEGIRVYNRRIFKLDEHLNRLYGGAKAIMLEVPLRVDDLKAAIVETVRRNDLTDGYVRLVVTRGKGDLGLNPLKCPKPTVFIIASTISIYPDDVYHQGMKIVTVSTRRNSIEALNPRIKSLNYLNNVLATLEVNCSDAQEGLMLNADGYVTECIVDNFFLVDQGVVVTPPTSTGALKGITRDTVMELAVEAGYKVEERVITLHDVYVADEAFLTGTAAEIAPITNVDERLISDGQPGPVTTDLMKRFHDYARSNGTPID